MCVIIVAVPYFSTGLIPYKVPFPFLMTHTVAAHFHGDFICHSVCVCMCVCVFSYFHTNNNPEVRIRASLHVL